MNQSHHSRPEPKDHKVLQYLSSNAIKLDFHFILTHQKELVVGMPYMLLEGSKTTAILLLDVWDDREYVYLKVQNIETMKINELSWRLDYKGEYWLWSISSYEFLMNTLE